MPEIPVYNGATRDKDGNKLCCDCGDRILETESKRCWFCKAMILTQLENRRTLSNG